LNNFFQVKYIAQCIEEIKQELKQDNIAVKANAISKLTYVMILGLFQLYLHVLTYYNFNPQLQMIGYDISWAGFNIIEVMSSNKFTFKRIGYLAGSQCFHQETEVFQNKFLRFCEY
jgi:AP-3 complex subunit delta